MHFSLWLVKFHFPLYWLICVYSPLVLPRSVDGSMQTVCSSLVRSYRLFLCCLSSSHCLLLLCLILKTLIPTGSFGWCFWTKCLAFCLLHSSTPARKDVSENSQFLCWIVLSFNFLLSYWAPLSCKLLPKLAWTRTETQGHKTLYVVLGWFPWLCFLRSAPYPYKEQFSP